MPAQVDQVAMDRTPFYGSKVPPNIAALRKLTNKLDKATFVKILRMAVSTLERKPVQQSMFDTIATTVVPVETVKILYAGILKLLQCAFRLSSASFTKEMFLADMSHIGLPKEMVDDLASAIFGSRRLALESVVICSRPRLASVCNTQWKIDVAISTTSLSRVLEPVVNLQLTLSTGEIKKFEMTIAKFQELRYNVASVLKEMENLEIRSILKLKN